MRTGPRKLSAGLLIVILMVMLVAPPMQGAQAAGSVSLTTFGSAYTQDFNTLASSGASSVVPTGWDFAETGTNANTTYTAGTGSSNTGDTYSFGASGSSERAFGGLRSGTLVPLIGAQFTNDAGGIITSLEVTYTGEQWRLGQNTTGRAADRLDFQLSLDATSLTSGTWSDYDALDFSSPVVAGTVGALDGNAAANRVTLTFLITGLSIPHGATFWIRWADSDLIPGADDGLAVDDFSLTPVGAVVVADPKINEFSASTVGTDVEYVEIFGDPNTDYSAYTVLEIEGDSGAAVGTVDEVIALGTTDANGLYLVNLPANALENGTLTLLLVKNFTGALNNDLDTDNDGVFDTTPWDAIVDSVAVNDGGVGDVTYGVPTLGVSYDGLPYAPGGASRIPDGYDTDAATDWVRNDFDLAGIPGYVGTPIVGEAYNTPGAKNAVVKPPPPQLVINEIDYDQPDTDTAEFIEIKNNGTSAVSLDGVTLELVNGNAGGAALYQTIVLPAVSLAAGDYFVVCANAATVANCDLDVSPDTNLIQNGAPDAVGLRYNGELIDAVSYEGNTGAPYTEGSGDGLVDTAVGAQSISRCPDGADTNVNNVDFVLAPITPGEANACVDAAPEVASTYPVNGATDFPVSADLTVTFSEPVNVTGAWYGLTCTVSGAVAAAVSGGPTTFTLNPTTDLVPGESCTLTIYAANVSDQDTNDPPDNMAGDVVVGFTTLNVCTLTFTPIYTIQGSGLATPIPGPVTTQGVVVGDYEGPSPALRGFYLQDLNGDGDPATSDGIFVFNGNNNSVSLGDVVRVTGTAAEFQDQTQVSASSIVKCGTGTVAPVDVTLPVPSATYLEQYEGMLVRFPQTLYVTEHYQLGRFGQVLLSAGGRLQQPTNVVLPGAPALAMQAANDLNKIILDDALNNQNPDPIVFGRGGLPLSASNTLRGGDTATGIVGILTYTWSGNSASGNAYRLRPINALDGGAPDFQPANPRPTSAPAVGGTVKVVGMNLLNYFNTFTGCTNGVGGLPTDCRGANNATEFERQYKKTVAAILAMNPDVVGFNEIENDGYGPDSAIADLVSRLNAATAPGTYALIDVDTATGQVNALGVDGIKVGMIYRPAAVTPVGQTAVLNSVAFVNGGDSAARNRPSLAQAFRVNANGAVFVVDVNHLKSKGSACDLPDQGDGQGNCNQVRLNAVNELMSWLATDPTGVGDPDILLIGDYNSYAMEDPIRALESGGYTHLIKTFLGPDAYSYVFDGQWGYLDHALGSASLAGQVTGVADYHINADEPSVLDYNTEYKSAGQIASLYAPDEFRISDHDPVIVGLLLDAPPMVNVSPDTQTVQYSDPIAPVTISAKDLATDTPLTAATSWKVGSGSFTPGLPDALALTAKGCTTAGSYATCTWTLSGKAMTAPGTYVVRVTVTDGGGDTASADITIEVKPEDARATYTGALFASTASTSSSVAYVTLAATVQDISVTSDAAGDIYPGDIRNATVTFVNRDAGNATLCTATVGLVNPGDLQTGTATCTWTADLGSANSLSAQIGIVVGGYYTRDSTGEDAIVTISKPLASQFITGGGYIVLRDSAGALAGDDGSRANFGFNVQYNRSGKSLRGNVTILVRRLEADGVVHVYQIKGNVMSSLAVQAGEGTAVFNGKANIQDVTNPLAPIPVGGNAVLQIAMDDNGEPGSGDTISITLWKKDGGLWFVSRWDGVKAVQQNLDGGNLIVR